MKRMKLILVIVSCGILYIGCTSDDITSTEIIEPTAKQIPDLKTKSADKSNLKEEEEEVKLSLKVIETYNNIANRTPNDGPGDPSDMGGDSTSTSTLTYRVEYDAGTTELMKTRVRNNWTDCVGLINYKSIGDLVEIWILDAAIYLDNSATCPAMPIPIPGLEKEISLHGDPVIKFCDVWDGIWN